jgi:hypothetical protein
MVREELVEGMKMAIEKGQALKAAMMAFFNAGYPKEEIEEAAREVQRQDMAVQKPKEIPISSAPTDSAAGKFQKLPQQNEVPSPPLSEIASKPQKPMKMLEPGQLKPGSKQKISDYGNGSQKPRKNFVIIFLIILLVFFVGLLVAIFLLKDELIGLLANLSA